MLKNMKSGAAAEREDTIAGRIVADLRRQTVTGELPAGSRLPAYLVLSTRYAVTGVTVNRAIRQLVTDGYLRSVRRCGVFVAQEPPHRTRFGEVFHSHPGSGFLFAQFQSRAGSPATRSVAACVREAWTQVAGPSC